MFLPTKRAKCSSFVPTNSVGPQDDVDGQGVDRNVTQDGVERNMADKEPSLYRSTHQHRHPSSGPTRQHRHPERRFPARRTRICSYQPKARNAVPSSRPTAAVLRMALQGRGWIETSRRMTLNATWPIKNLPFIAPTRQHRHPSSGPTRQHRHPERRFPARRTCICSYQPKGEMQFLRPDKNRRSSG